jgi:hypothetical protein
MIIEYYFDTSVVRSIFSQFSNIKNKINLYITALNIVELIGALTDNTFSLIKLIIRNIIDNEMNFRWDFPEDILANAYGDNKFPYDLKKDLNRIVLQIYSADNYENLISLDNKTKYFFDINYFKKYDELSQSPSSILQEERIKTFKKKYLEIQEFNKKNNINNLDYETLVNSLNSYPFFYQNYISAIEALARYIVPLLNKNNKSECLIQEYCKKYNKSIDIMIISYAFYDIDKLSKKELCCRNDYNDIFHLLYLGNNYNERVLVSDDKIHKSLSKLMPNSIIDKDQLIKELGI